MKVLSTLAARDHGRGLRGQREHAGFWPGRVLGTRTKIAFTDRTAEPLGVGELPAGPKRAYRVTSMVLARMFVLGIPVKRTRLESEEWIEPDTGLIRHRLIFRDGSVSVAERMARVGTAALRVDDGSDRQAHLSTRARWE